MAKLRVDTTNTGNGVFAYEDITKGALIIRMSGRAMSSEAVEAAIVAGNIRADDPFQIDEDFFIKLNKLPYLFNHSCEPNAGFKQGRNMVALCDISKGEEICYDYSSVVCTHCEWSMKCLCGKKSCRKKVGNATTLPKKVLEKYVKMGLLPKFIEKEVKTAVSLKR